MPRRADGARPGPCGDAPGAAGAPSGAAREPGAWPWPNTNVKRTQQRFFRQAAESYKAGEIDAFYETLALAAFREREVSITLAKPQDPDCPLIGCSKGFERLTGYPRSEIIGRNCRFLNKGCGISAEDRHRMRMAVRTGRSFTGVLRNRRKTGEIFLNLLHLSALRIGSTVYIVGIQADVTGADVDPAKEATAAELQRVVDAIFAANIDAWARLQVMQFDDANEPKGMPLAPVLEGTFHRSFDASQYSKARAAFVAVEHDLLQNPYKYKNTFLEVCDDDEDPRTFLMGLRRIFSEPALRVTCGSASLTLEELPTTFGKLCPFTPGESPFQARPHKLPNKAIRKPPPRRCPLLEPAPGPDAQQSSSGVPVAPPPDLPATPPESECPVPDNRVARGEGKARGGSRKKAAQQDEDEEEVANRRDGFGEEARDEPRLTGPTSAGSGEHPHGCTPCSFFCYSLAGCNRGEACLFCHMEHPRKSRRRGKKNRCGPWEKSGSRDASDAGEGEEAEEDSAARAHLAAAEDDEAEASPSAGGLRSRRQLLGGERCPAGRDGVHEEPQLPCSGPSRSKVPPPLMPDALLPLLSALELLAPLPALLGSGRPRTSRNPKADEQSVAASLQLCGPLSLEYSEANIVVTVGQRILLLPFVAHREPLVAVELRFAVEQPLPRGLTLDPLNGVISGLTLQSTASEGSSHNVSVRSGAERASAGLHFVIFERAETSGTGDGLSSSRAASSTEEVWD